MYIKYRSNIDKAIFLINYHVSSKTRICWYIFIHCFWKL